MLLAGEDSIREIIPFPMNKNAQDLMMGAPSQVEQKQLEDVHIQIKLQPDLNKSQLPTAACKPAKFRFGGLVVA